MKILVATEKREGLTDTVSAKFGRAKTFTIIYVENNKIQQAELHANEYYNASGNAGVKAAEFAGNHHVNVVIAGNIQPKALEKLKELGIKTEIGHAGKKVSEVIKPYLQPKTSVNILSTKQKKTKNMPVKTNSNVTSKNSMIKGIAIAALVIVMILLFQLLKS